MFASGGTQGTRPDDMPERVLDDWWWLVTYKLTPEQVDRLPLADYDFFPMIEQARARAAAIRAATRK